MVGLQCNLLCLNWWRTDIDRIFEEKQTLSCISSSIPHTISPNWAHNLKTLSQVLYTFFNIFPGPVGCPTLTMTQIPTTHKYEKLMKGATLSDVYSFAPLKLHWTRMNSTFPTSIISLHEAMYSLRSCYIVSISKSGK